MATTRGQAKGKEDYGPSHSFEDTYVPPMGAVIRQGDDHSPADFGDSRLGTSPHFATTNAVSDSPIVPGQWGTPT